MKILKKLLVFLLFFCVLSLYAQNSSDSLLNLIKSTNIDTIKVNTYIELAWINSRLNPEKSKEYSSKAIEISEKIGYAIGLIDGYNRLGSAYHNKGENIKALEFYQKSYDLAVKANNLLKQSIAISNMANVYNYTSNLDKSIEYYNKSLEIELKLNNKEGIASEYHGLGNVYKDKGDYAKSMEYMFKALSIREELGDKKQVSTLYMSIGSLYYSLQNFDLALSYFNKVYSIILQTDDKSSLADVLGNMGVLYMEKREIDSALMKYEESVEVSKQIGDDYSLAMGYSNIASIYYFKTDFKSAIEYNQKCIELREKVEDIEGVIHSLSNFGDIYTKLNQYDKAIEYTQKAVNIAIEKKLFISAQYCEGQISALYADINDFKNAYKHHLRYKEISDSLSSDDNVKKLTQLEMQFEFDKIQKQQAFEQEQKEISQKAELSKQKVLRNSFIFGFILMILLAYVMFKNYKRKKKDNQLLTFQNQEIRQQKEEISAQRDEIETQRDLVTQQKDRIEEIHKEVTDSINYALRIQQAMLPSLSSKSQILRTKNQDMESEKLRNSEMRCIEPAEMFIEKESNINLVATTNDNQSDKTTCDIVTSQDSSLKSQTLEFETWNLEFETFVLFHPKDIVSGDFFWATQVADIKIYAVADCTGHGVPGAFMSMLGISFLNEIVRRKEVIQANQVLNHLREEIINALQQTGQSGEQKDGMDISLIVIKSQVQSPKSQASSSKSKVQSDEHLQSSNSPFLKGAGGINSELYQAQWAGANNPLWVVRIVTQSSGLLSNEPEVRDTDFPNFQNLENLEEPTNQRFVLQEVKPDKMPIAIYDRMDSFTNHEIQLQKGDTIYLMSDGFQDQFGGPNGKKYKSYQLKKLLIDNSEKSLSEQKEVLETTLINWIGRGEQIDDITILGIKI